MSAGIPDFAQLAGGQPAARHQQLPRARPVRGQPTPQPTPTPGARLSSAMARPASRSGTVDFSRIAGDTSQMHLTPPLIPGAAKAVGGIFGILSRPGQAGAALGAHRGFGAAWHALLHGETAQQSEADVEQLARNFIGHVSGGRLSYDRLPGAVKSTVRFAVQTSFDPLTYAGGSGLMREGATRLGLSALPAVSRASSVLAKRFPSTMEYLQRAGGETHDYFQPGGRPAGHAVRTEAARHGAAGVANFQRAVAAENAARTQGAFLAATQTRLFRQALKGISDGDQSQIFRAIHKGTVAQLPANLRAAAERVVQIDRSTLHLAGSGALQRQIAQKGFALPDELSAFAAKRPRNLVRTNMYRENHIPGVDAPKEQEVNDLIAGTPRVGYKSDPTSTVNKFFQPREVDLPESYFNDPAQIRSAFERSFRAGGHAIAGRDLRERIAGMFAKTSAVQRTRAFNARAGMPDVPLNKTPRGAEDIFKGPYVVNRGRSPLRPMAGVKNGYELHDVPPKTPVQPSDVITGSARSYRNVPPHIRAMFAAKPGQQIGALKQGVQWAQNVANLGKALPFAVPFVHQRNIGTLLATANPGRLADAVVTYAKLKFGFARPEEYYRVLGDAAKAGATGVPNFEQSRLEQALRQYVPVIGSLAARVYGASGKMLWAFDDAAKAALYRGERGAAGDPLLAAFRAQSKLVDYSRTSPFIENLRIGLPFAIWAARMPAALTRSMVQHPERALALYRATGGAIAGEPFTFRGKQYEASNPLSEVNLATSGGSRTGKPLGASLLTYPRARLSLSAKEAGDLIAQLTGDTRNWFTSGVDPATYALQRGPGVGLASQYSGHGAFNQSPEEAALFTLSGIHRAPVPPTPRQKALYGVYQQTLRMLQSAKNKGEPNHIIFLQRRADWLKAQMDALDKAARQ